MKNNHKILVVSKPWGKFEQFTLNEQSTVKILTVNPESRLSYQAHKNREEFWLCIEGEVIALIEDVVYKLKKDQQIYIPKGAKHRLIGTKKIGKVLEISFGFFDEEDIIRYEDDYGRIK
jgi:mannose-6-phosphate isomerase-like protein (cupin superfamily)